MFTAVLMKMANSNYNTEQVFFEFYCISYEFFQKMCREYHVPKDHIPDLLQEFYIKCWRNRHRFAEKENGSGYVMRMIRNTINDYLRQQKREANVLMTDSNLVKHAGAHFPASSSNVSTDPGEFVLAVIQQLPDRQKAVCQYLQQGHKRKAVAALMNISVSAVDQYYREAKKKIIAALRALR